MTLQKTLLIGALVFSSQVNAELKIEIDHKIEQKEQQELKFLESQKGFIENFNLKLNEIKMFRKTKQGLWQHLKFERYTEDYNLLLRINKDNSGFYHIREGEYSNQKTYKNFSNYGICISDLSLASHFHNQNKAKINGTSQFDPYIIDYTNNGSSIKHEIKNNGDSSIKISDTLTLDTYDKMRSAKNNSDYNPKTIREIVSFNFDDEQLGQAKRIYNQLNNIHSTCQNKKDLVKRIRKAQNLFNATSSLSE